MSTLGRIALIGMLVAGLALVAIQVAAADGSPSPTPGGTRTLVGEEFLVNEITLTLSCDDPAQVSTVQFSASGPATGPYPGTFTAQGTVTIAPQTLPGSRPGALAGPLQSLTETFTITSVLGTVAGHKTLQPGQPFDQSQGTCEHVTNFTGGGVTGASGTVVDLFSQPAYDATIQEPSGTYYVQGETSFNADELNLDGICADGTPCHHRAPAFDEYFLTSNPVPGTENNDDGLESQFEQQLEQTGAH
jgi:hypothetical protein